MNIREVAMLVACLCVLIGIATAHEDFATGAAFFMLLALFLLRFGDKQ